MRFRISDFGFRISQPPPRDVEVHTKENSEFGIRNSELVSDRLQTSEGVGGNSKFKIQNSEFWKALCA